MHCSEHAAQQSSLESVLSRSASQLLFQECNSFLKTRLSGRVLEFRFGHAAQHDLTPRSPIRAFLRSCCTLFDVYHAPRSLSRSSHLTNNSQRVSIHKLYTATRPNRLRHQRHLVDMDSDDIADIANIEHDMPSLLELHQSTRERIARDIELREKDIKKHERKNEKMAKEMAINSMRIKATKLQNRVAKLHSRIINAVSSPSVVA